MGNITDNAVCRAFPAYCNSLQDEKLTVKLSMVKERYRNGEVVEYVCNAPDANDEGSATCVDGEWNKTGECQGKKCQDKLEN